MQHFSHCKSWSGENCNCEEAALQTQYKLGLLFARQPTNVFRFKLSGPFEQVMKAYREIMEKK